jgi:hypothetical protein
MVGHRQAVAANTNPSALRSLDAKKLQTVSGLVLKLEGIEVIR